MRFAVISDAHGNAFALHSVLDDIRAAAPDLIINLGDQVYGRADPRTAYELQAELGAVEVRGNTEEMLQDDSDFADWLWTQLPAGAERLPKLPLTRAVAGGQVVACHGSLAETRGHLLWQWQQGPYLARSAAELRGTLAGISAAVVLCGHTHREAMTRLDDTLIINVGAVGNQVDGDPRARWLLLEESAGQWCGTFQRVIYDCKAAGAWMRCHAPDPQEEIQNLLTGW